jgi:hypothetical protein
MNVTSNLIRARRGLAALAVTATLATAGSAALGGGVAAADPGALAARSDEPVAIGPNPATIRWMVAVATCSEIYPPGTDIRACIANLY